MKSQVCHWYVTVPFLVHTLPLVPHTCIDVPQQRESPTTHAEAVLAILRRPRNWQMELKCGKPSVENNQNNKIRRRIGIQPENDFPEDVNNQTFFWGMAPVAASQWKKMCQEILGICNSLVTIPTFWLMKLHQLLRKWWFTIVHHCPKRISMVGKDASSARYLHGQPGSSGSSPLDSDLDPQASSMAVLGGSFEWRARNGEIDGDIAIIW